MWQDLYVLTYRHLRGRGVPHFDAEDIAQEVLTSAYVNLDGIEPGKLRSWLLAAARNKAVDRYRSARRLTCLEEGGEFVDPGPNPADIVIRSAEGAAVRRAMRQLPARDARLLEMRYFEERSLTETAEAVGASATTTKVALFRARRRLRRVLEAEEQP